MTNPILREMKKKKFFIHYKDYLPYVMSHLELDGDFFEFGTYQGNTASMMVKYLNTDRNFHLFDTFTGLPEKWDGRENKAKFDKGAFDVGGKLPDIGDDRAVFHVGLFSDTLPLLEEHNIAFIHIDCDLYTSTKDVFDNIGKYIKSGTVIMFDEFYNYAGYHKHEIKAFSEWVEDNNIQYEFIAYTRKYHAAIRIL